VKRARLDNFLRARLDINRQDIRTLLARGCVKVDGVLATEINQVIDQFSHISLDDKVLQAYQPTYIMLNKPAGIVSATTDEKHTTVIDLLDCDDKGSLHIVGRLDYNTTGLVLLTNDSSWSSRITEPDQKVSKHYRVTLEKPLTPEYIEAFAAGMYFAFEGITTRPAKLRILSGHVAEVELVEGRYHQIKRMFGHLGNKVVALHRFAVGNLELDASLQSGESRTLTEYEVNYIK
jgi:16S rRNA pseudouridine516 synthase